eukprot:m.105596 g.105596  ORF g.105596 m.105596 type:complete len:178 (+) comp16876_c1_seq1:181-714(+)
MGAQPSRSVAATMDDDGSINLTADVLKRLDGGPEDMPLTTAEQRKLQAAAEGLRKQYDNLNDLLSKAKSTGYNTGWHVAKAASPEDLTTLVIQLEEELDRARDLAEAKIQDESSSIASRIEQDSALLTIENICEIEEDQVIKCYQSDPTKTLDCSHLVEAYVQCANAAREARFATLE